MTYTAILHPLVNQDIVEGYDWYESSKAGLGEEFVTNVREKITEIIKHPHTYSSKYNVNYREAIIEKFPYVIVYKINKKKKEVFVASIHHSKKHPKLKYR